MRRSKLRVTGLCEGNSPVTGEFSAQRASNAENVSIWWRHHEIRDLNNATQTAIFVFHRMSSVLLTWHWIPQTKTRVRPRLSEDKETYLKCQHLLICDMKHGHDFVMFFMSLYQHFVENLRCTYPYDIGFTCIRTWGGGGILSREEGR